MSPIENTASTPTQPACPSATRFSTQGRPMPQQLAVSSSHSHTSSENQPIDGEPMCRVRSHSAIQIRIIPLGNLCHFRPVCCFSQSLHFLLRCFVLGCWVGELQRCSTPARSCVRPYSGRCEARGVFDVLRHCAWLAARGRGGGGGDRGRRRRGRVDRMI
jgi:hypothetical protein